jgi:hypothetical protein
VKEASSEKGLNMNRMRVAAGRTSSLTLSLIVVLTVAPVGSGAAYAAGAISGPPTMNAELHTRNPRICEKITHVPSGPEAAALSQCYKESAGNDFAALLENVQVQIGGSRPYSARADGRNAGIDTTAKVYPIRVQADYYGCAKSNNFCMVSHFRDAEGTCVKSTFGDWGCSFNLASPDPEKVQKPKPTSY